MCIRRELPGRGARAGEGSPGGTGVGGGRQPGQGAAGRPRVCLEMGRHWGLTRRGTADARVCGSHRPWVAVQRREARQEAEKGWRDTGRWSWPGALPRLPGLILCDLRHPLTCVSPPAGHILFLPTRGRHCGLRPLSPQARNKQLARRHLLAFTERTWHLLSAREHLITVDY